MTEVVSEDGFVLVPAYSTKRRSTEPVAVDRMASVFAPTLASLPVEPIVSPSVEPLVSPSIEPCVSAPICQTRRAIDPSVVERISAELFEKRYAQYHESLVPPTTVSANPTAVSNNSHSTQKTDVETKPPVAVSTVLAPPPSARGPFCLKKSFGSNTGKLWHMSDLLVGCDPVQRERHAEYWTSSAKRAQSRSSVVLSISEFFSKAERLQDGVFADGQPRVTNMPRAFCFYVAFCAEMEKSAHRASGDPFAHRASDPSAHRASDPLLEKNLAATLVRLGEYYLFGYDTVRISHAMAYRCFWHAWRRGEASAASWMIRLQWSHSSGGVAREIQPSTLPWLIAGASVGCSMAQFLLCEYVGAARFSSASSSSSAPVKPVKENDGKENIEEKKDMEEEQEWSRTRTAEARQFFDTHAFQNRLHMLDLRARFGGFLWFQKAAVHGHAEAQWQISSAGGQLGFGCWSSLGQERLSRWTAIARKSIGETEQKQVPNEEKQETKEEKQETKEEETKEHESKEMVDHRTAAPRQKIAQMLKTEASRASLESIWDRLVSTNESASEVDNQAACSAVCDLLLLTRAANQGDLNAMADLSTRYLEGYGVPKDAAIGWQWANKVLHVHKDEAFEYHNTRRALNGEWASEVSSHVLGTVCEAAAKANWNLAVAFAFGLHVPVHKPSAVSHFREAYAAGHKIAGLRALALILGELFDESSI